MLFEGGLAGHMSHPFDYTDFTCNDFIELIDSLFSGKIENMKEKLDGTNINATVNTRGEVVYIRNNTDLNSERGGMTIDDMKKRWESLPAVAANFVNGGKILKKILSKVDNKFFNPAPDVRVVVNCECIKAGATNVMLYNADRVAVHGTATYKFENGKWNEVERSEGIPREIEIASRNIAEATPRPQLIINSVEKAQQYKTKFISDITRMFNDEGLDKTATLEQYKKKRFDDIAPEWMDDTMLFFNRWFNNDKSTNLTSIKKRYKEHASEISQLDKNEYKNYIIRVMKPIDTLFLRIGNALISICDGFTNKGNEDDVVAKLTDTLKSTVAELRANASDTTRNKLEYELSRLQELDNKINAEEGITFMYKGRLMKLTGSFAPLNQILGTIKFNR